MSLTINEELTQEATRLKAEIAQLNAASSQTDADGTPSVDAVMAQKRLPQLNDDYRVLLQTLNVAPKTISTADGRTLQLNPATNQYDIELGAKPVTAAAPDIQIINGNAYKVEANGNLTLVQDKTQTPGYQAPAPTAPVRDPVADANAIGVAAAQRTVDAYKADLASGKVMGRADELKLEADLAALAAETNAKIKRAQDDQTYALGQPQRDIENTRAQSTETRAQSAEARAVEQAKANLAQAQAGEARAQGADARAALTARQTPQIAALKDQAAQAQANVASSIKLGIAPTRSMANAPYDAYARMQAILNEQPAQVAQLQPQQVPTAPQIAAPPAAPTAAPQIYDSSPSGSSMGGQAPNVPTPLWQQGPAATGMANDQTSLWGQDKPTQSLFLSTYNNDPILASQMWAKQHNAPPQAPTVGPPRAPTLN